MAISGRDELILPGAGRPRRSPRGRRHVLGVVLAAVLAVAAVLAGSELVARVAVRGGSEAASREREELLAAVPGAASGDVRADDVRAAPYRAYGSRYELHPFFGYTFAPGVGAANNQGFLSGVGDFPYRKGPRELVIGLFGGSVAMQVAGAPASLLDRLRPALQAKGYDRLTLVSFAAGGWRQPQSFFALAHYLPMIDLAIEIDGFNEVIETWDEHLRDYPASFPWSDVYGPLARGTGSPEEILRTAELIRANRAAVETTGLVSNTPLRHSMLAHLVWRVYAGRYRERVTRLRAAGQDGIHEQWSGIEPLREPGGEGAKRDAYLAYYADLIRYSDSIARRKGRPFFHFVQPNQYLEGSKPLSDEERRLRVPHTGWFGLVTPQYRRLEAATQELRAEGVESHFLGWLFAGDDETLYEDDCCHLNTRGVELLNAAIAEQILASGRLDSVPPAR